MNKRILQLVLPVFIISLSGKIAAAQSMSMPMPMHHSLSSSQKNVYLAIMDTMMVRMDKILQPASPESDFIRQMIPHHKGAVSMAKYEISHGKSSEMIQLAKSILAEQSSEIGQMNIWVKKMPLAPQRAKAEYISAMNKTMSIMMDTMPANNLLNDNDHAFAMVMIPHHQAAVDMAKVLLTYSTDQQITAFAKQLISSEEIEIEQMLDYTKTK